MVRQSYTAVVERNRVWTGHYETEPYEAAWASEAIFFIPLWKPAIWKRRYRPGFKSPRMVCIGAMKELQLFYRQRLRRLPLAGSDTLAAGSAWLGNFRQAAR